MFKGQVTDIFFDLDHTLWDFEKNSALTFERIFFENDLDIDLDKFLRIYIPQNLAFWKLYREERISKTELRYRRLKTVFDRMGIAVPDHMIDRLSEQYILHLSSFGHLLPGTIEILKYLAPTYRLHIITNGFHEIQHKKMRNSNIYDFFDKIIDSEMAGVKKPNPHIFKLALKKARTSPEKSLMIGDNLEADIIGAQTVGFHTIHFDLHGETPHDLCPMISDLNEIKTYL